MSDPLALQIIDGIATRLAAIDGTGDFHTAPTAVYQGNRTLDDDELALVVFSGKEKGGDASHPRIAAELEVHVEGQHPLADKEDGERQANLLIADVQRAVELADRTLGGLARRFVKYAGRVVAYPQDGARLVHVRVSYNVGYHRTFGNPDLNR